MAAPATRSVLRCPHCGHSERLAMPAAACVVCHDCVGCGAVLRPKPGDCCVFCSYGSVACPPVQAARRSGQLRRADAGDAAG